MCLRKDVKGVEGPGVVEELEAGPDENTELCGVGDVRCHFGRLE